MATEPYASARRVFWIVDNGPSHRWMKAIDRLTRAFPNAAMAHTPVHASWTNQIEVFFSIVQRKVVLPNDFPADPVSDIASNRRSCLNHHGAYYGAVNLPPAAFNESLPAIPPASSPSTTPTHTASAPASAGPTVPR